MAESRDELCRRHIEQSMHGAPATWFVGIVERSTLEDGIAGKICFTDDCDVLFVVPLTEVRERHEDIETVLMHRKRKSKWRWEEALETTEAFGFTSSGRTVKPSWRDLPANTLAFDMLNNAAALELTHLCFRIEAPRDSVLRVEFDTRSTRKPRDVRVIPTHRFIPGGTIEATPS